MKGRPVKFRILEMFANEGRLWSYEVVDMVAKEYKDRSSRYGRNSTIWTLVELSAAGFIAEVDSKINDSTDYGTGGLFHRYGLTEIGRAELERLRGIVKPR